MSILFPDLGTDFDDGPICWEPISCAIYDWVVENIQITDAIWNNQNVPQAGYPYASLFGSGLRRFGTGDEKREQTDLNAPAGEEHEIRHQGPREFTLSVMVHTDPDNGAYVASQSAVALATKLQASLAKLSEKARFGAAGLCVVNEGDVLDTSVEVNAEWISRANLDVIFRTTSIVRELVGIIETVQTEGTGEDPPNPSVIVNKEIEV